VLDDSSRVRIVEAAPGSGKTWLIAEAMLSELKGWPSSTGGVAALSFTNVAGEEIADALGGEPAHPHLVATIDRFLFRYVVKPFAAKLNAYWPTPRLLPADAVDSVQHLRGYGDVRVAVTDSKWKESLFHFDFTGEEAGAPIFTVRSGWRSQTLDSKASLAILEEKKRLWRKTGYVSHSDAAYIASVITARMPASNDITRLIGRRFPVLIVDELQDTGWYRSAALLALLRNESVRGLVVGDPDQAIYEFNGATPEVFEAFKDLPGARVLTLNESRRCPPEVCRVACALSDTRRIVRPSAERARELGTATLLVYDNPLSLVRRFEDLAASLAPQKVVFLARKNTDIDKLQGLSRPAEKPLRSRPLELLKAGVEDLRRGHQQRALRLSYSALAWVVFGHDAPHRDDFSAVGVSEVDWKRVVVATLLHAEERAQSVSVYEWGCGLKDYVRERLDEAGLWEGAVKPLALRAPGQKVAKQMLWGERYATLAAAPSSLVFSTVHGVKGETHHTTVLFVPVVSEAKCPSVVWWAGDTGGREEGRVAFVAVTRAASDFVLAVHRSTYRRLEERQPEFVSLLALEELNS